MTNSSGARPQAAPTKYKSQHCDPEAESTFIYFFFFAIYFFFFAVFLGIFAPDLRASLRAMATACFRLATFFPLPPDFARLVCIPS
jgi:hypothetical protein